jgi:putative DNA primase/helicase
MDMVAWEAAELAAWERRQASKAAEAEHAAARRKAADKADSMWSHAPAASPEHPYLRRKRIAPGPARLAYGKLVLPVFDAESGELLTLQFIGAEGEKKFLRDGRTKAGFSPLGDLAGDGPLVICEGFSTGMSIRLATGLPVVAAFNAGNLEAVAQALRARFPDRRIVLAADNDATEGRVNVGVEKATAAARAVDGALVVPAMAGDFNDLAVRHGLAAVRAAFSEGRPA